MARELFGRVSCIITNLQQHAVRIVQNACTVPLQYLHHVQIGRPDAPTCQMKMLSSALPLATRLDVGCQATEKIAPVRQHKQL